MTKTREKTINKANLDKFIKVHTPKEAREAVRLQLTLNKEVEDGLHKFYYACTSVVITVSTLVALYIYTAQTGFINATLVFILATILVIEGALLYKYRRYNPIAVYRTMLYEHDYGVVKCAIDGSWGHNNEFIE